VDFIHALLQLSRHSERSCDHTAIARLIVSTDLEVSFFKLYCPCEFVIMKPTRCTNFSDYFWNEILHVSDSSSVHHQEFFTVHTAVVYVIQVCWQLSSRIRMELEYSKNKFEKLVRLLGFIIRNLSQCRVTWTSYLLLWSYWSGCRGGSSFGVKKKKFVSFASSNLHEAWFKISSYLTNPRIQEYTNICNILQYKACRVNTM